MHPSRASLHFRFLPTLGFGALALTLALLAGCATESRRPPAAAPPILTNTPPASTNTLSRTVQGRVIAFGTYSVRLARRTMDFSNTPVTSASSNVMPIVSFSQMTERIPGVVNTRFGFVYEITGLPARTLTTLTLTTRHPPIRFPDGQETTEHKRQVQLTTDDAGAISNSMGYSFDLPCEIVPGRWTMQVSLGEQTLARQGFLVLAPATASPQAQPTPRLSP